MRIFFYSKIMNCNALCNRIMCCIKVGFRNRSKSILTRHGKYGVFQHTPVLWTFSKEINLSSLNRNDESIEEAGETEDLLLSSSTNIVMEDYSEQFRNTLYPESSDLLISQLKSCESINEIFSIMKDHSKSLSTAHYCQILLVLYDILIKKRSKSSRKPQSLLPNNSMSELPETLSSVLLKVLGVLAENAASLRTEELVCCVLYSTRLGVDLKNPLIQTILMKINELLSVQDANLFPISALSRLTIAFDNNKELWTKIFLIKTLPLIYIHFDRCQSIEDFRALTISMLSNLPYLREELLIEYESLTEEFLRKGVLTRDHTSVIVKAAVLLNNVYDQPTARYMTYKLLHMLHGHLDNLFPPHLLELQKIVFRQVEPQYTMREIKDLKKSCTFMTVPDSALIYLYLPLMDLPMDAKGSSYLKELISKSDILDHLMNCQIHLTTARPNVCLLFWSKVAELLKNVAVGEFETLQRVCLRYMYFSKLMVSYHHREFESVMMSLIARELAAGATLLQPRQTALFAAFVLMFDMDHGAASLSNDVVSRLLAVSEQLDAQSCLRVSWGIRERLQRAKDIQTLLQVDSAINERTRELLKSEDTSSIKTFNRIFRSCINRKQSMESDVMLELLKRSETLKWSELTSRSLRNLMYNLHITSTLLPAAVDRMVEYCLTNAAYVTGSTTGKLLYMCYHLGHSPRHLQGFCSLVASLVTRDRYLLNGQNLLQVALALSFFNQLPSSVIKIIFTVDFLEKLDNEIKHCFAKDRYPMRVRQTLMELNRSVCLDHPEADVPWFHTKYCEEQKALDKMEAVPKSVFFTDVYATLLGLVGDSKYIGTKTYTPYDYVLDMQLNLDAALNPVLIRNTEKVAHKLALLLYYGDSYTTVEQRLKGYYQMKERHLEILGYRVITLSDSLWNAMFMTEPKAKLEYLRNLVWPT